MITLIIPVFNEEQSIAETIRRGDEALKKTGKDYEIVAVNDGSFDRTAEILQNTKVPSLTVITHSINRGYGASMKTAIRRSRGDIFVTTDADGTYPIEEIPMLIDHQQKTSADMVVAARTKKGAKIPWNRRPAKAVIRLLSNFLVGRKIPDNNSGMRVFTRSLAEEFMHLYPNGFSFTLTITLASLTSGYLVEFVPVDYFKRTGKSSMSAGFNGVKHFVDFLMLIVRIMTYFRPARFFLWPGVLFFLAGIALAVYTLTIDRNVSDAGLLLIVTGIQIGLFGLLAEVIVRHGHRQ
jgi:glycosyltransferase involved in cell wall biosynthesis